MDGNNRKRVRSWTADSGSHNTLADPPTGCSLWMTCPLHWVQLLTHIVWHCRIFFSRSMWAGGNCAPTRLRDRWNSGLWLTGCGGELSVLHVWKLPPEVNKMVPSVNSSTAGPLQRPEINFGAFILWERRTMGVQWRSVFNWIIVLWNEGI